MRATSKNYYRRMFSLYLPDWGNKPLRDITPEMVEQRYKEDIPRDVKQRQKGVRVEGHAAANATLLVLSTVWNFKANRDRSLPENPVHRLKGGWYKIDPRTRMVPSDDLPRFYAAVDALPSRTMRDYLLLLLFTGMRRGEAGALRWDEVDLKERIIRIPGERMKSRKEFNLPMSDLVHGLLVARRAIGKEGIFVFPAESRSGHVEEPNLALRQIGTETGIVVSAHDLRRTFMTIAEETDISPLALNRTLPSFERKPLI
jgi:integrase